MRRRSPRGRAAARSCTRWCPAAATPSGPPRWAATVDQPRRIGVICTGSPVSSASTTPRRRRCRAAGRAGRCPDRRAGPDRGAPTPPRRAAVLPDQRDDRPVAQPAHASSASRVADSPVSRVAIIASETSARNRSRSRSPSSAGAGSPGRRPPARRAGRSVSRRETCSRSPTSDGGGRQPAAGRGVEAAPGHRRAGAAGVQQEAVEDGAAQLGQSRPDAVAGQLAGGPPDQRGAGRVDVADRPVRVEQRDAVGQPVQGARQRLPTQGLATGPAHDDSRIPRTPTSEAALDATSPTAVVHGPGAGVDAGRRPGGMPLRPAVVACTPPAAL